MLPPYFCKIKIFKTLLTNLKLYDIIIKSQKCDDAGMMELADVPDSKSGGSDTVRVRPPLPAPKQKSTHKGAFLFCGSDGENLQKN